MADEAYFLTESDRDVLRRLAEDAGLLGLQHRGGTSENLGRSKRGKNIPFRKNPSRGWPTPDVYIAKLADFSGTGTGTGTGTGDLTIAAMESGESTGEADHVHSGFCFLYKIVPSGKEGQSWDLVRVGTDVVEVFNLSEQQVVSDDWLLAIRDKFGRWVAYGTHSETVTDFFQLLTDIEGDCFAAFANPGLYGTGDDLEGHVPTETTQEQVELLSCLGMFYSGTITIHANGLTTSEIAYDESIETFLGNMNTALAATFGSGAFVASASAMGSIYILCNSPLNGHFTVYGSASGESTTYREAVGVASAYQRMRYDPTITWTWVEDEEFPANSEWVQSGPVISPDNTVILIDSTRRLNSWIGDWVTAQDTGETIEAYYPSPYPDGDTQHNQTLGEFKVYEVVNRLSDQSAFECKLLTLLWYRGSAIARVYINSYARTALLLLEPDPIEDGKFRIDLETVKPIVITDNLLSRVDDYIYGSAAADGPTVFVQYRADTRTWRLTEAPCPSE